MPDVFFKLTAEEKEAVNALLKVLDSQKKVEGGYKSIRNASAETDKAAAAMGKSFESAGKTIADGLLPGITKIGTFAGVAALGVSAINEELERGRKRTEAYSAEVLKLSNALAQAGKINLFPEIEKQVKEIAASSKSMTESQVRGVAAALGPDARKLNATTLTESIRYGVRGADAGLDAGASAKTYAQLAGNFPGEVPEVLEKAAGQLLSLKGESLGDDEILQAKRGRAGGQHFQDIVATLLARRKSGETAKTFDRIQEQMGEEITPEMLKPHEEIRAENKARVEALKQENLDLKSQEDATKRASIKKKIQKQLTLNSHEIERLEADKVETFTPEQERLKRLAAIPEEQRSTAWLNDPTLVKANLRPKAVNLTAAINDIRANPPADLLAATRAQSAALPADARETIRSAQAFAKAKTRSGEVDSGLDRPADNEEVLFQTFLNKRYANRGGGFLAGARRKLDELDHFSRGGLGSIGSDFEQFKKIQAYKSAHADDEPQEVHVVEDSSKIKRTEPARNGGN